MSNLAVEFEFPESGYQVEPGGSFDCAYRLAGNEVDQLQAIETSVLWRTVGKGSEDLGVHFFDRRSKRELTTSNQLSTNHLHRFSITLPNSPLSYEGEILQIHWLIRVRLFFRHAKRRTFDLPLRLGSVPRPSEWKATLPQTEEVTDEPGAPSGPGQPLASTLDPLSPPNQLPAPPPSSTHQNDSANQKSGSGERSEDSQPSGDEMAESGARDDNGRPEANDASDSAKADQANAEEEDDDAK